MTDDKKKTATNGKGSKRRPEDSKRLADNWDAIKWPKRGKR